MRIYEIKGELSRRKFFSPQIRFPAHPFLQRYTQMAHAARRRAGQFQTRLPEATMTDQAVVVRSAGDEETVVQGRFFLIAPLHSLAEVSKVGLFICSIHASVSRRNRIPPHIQTRSIVRPNLPLKNNLLSKARLLQGANFVRGTRIRVALDLALWEVQRVQQLAR